ncbi:MAG TPA: alpha/beta fold hydrolase [Gaiellaceae bacterium]|nr:alpha/beta fold hydrolase [Gaiellaceae bacterium]
MKVVLLHALPLDERMWERQLETLRGRDAVAPRLYGRGRTMDDWAASVLADVDGDELVLVGASMGGYCALRMVAQAPDRVRALLLAGSRADADSEERRAARVDTLATIARDGAAGLWETMRPKLFSEAASADVVEHAHSLALGQRPDELAAAVEAIRDRPDSTEAARSLPLGLVLGDRDPYVDEAYARELVAGSPHAWRLTVPDCGHLPPLEQPFVFNAVLVGALAQWT